MNRLLPFLLLLPCFVSAQIITTVAGSGATGMGAGSFSGDGGQATAATFNLVSLGGFDSSGNMYIGDKQNNRVRVVNTSGIVHTISGNGFSADVGDGGPASAAQLQNPDITLDQFGNCYIIGASSTVRKISRTGIITGFAGTGTAGYSGDGGPATAALIYEPNGIAFDTAGNVFFSDAGNQCIREVTTSGTISTIAGTGSFVGTGAFSGDGGPASAAHFSMPAGLAFDKMGNLYVADYENNRVRKIDHTTGIITTIAGSGPIGLGAGSWGGDGYPATAASLNGPAYLIFDVYGDLIIADYINGRTRMIDTAGIITTIAGNGITGFMGDGGPATAAEFHFGGAEMAFDSCGNLYLSDPWNHRVRKITDPTPPVITLSGPTSAATGSLVSLTALLEFSGTSYTIRWMKNGFTFSTTTGPSTTYTKGAGVDTITAEIVRVNAFGCVDSSAASFIIILTGTTGIPQAYGTDLKLFPNPAHALLNIVSPVAVGRVVIYDLLGRQVFTQEYASSSDAAIPVANLPGGTYILKANGSFLRFVKE